MQILENIGSAIMLLTQPLAEYLAEKIASRFGPAASPLRKIAMQALVFSVVLLPALAIAVCLLVLLLFGVNWLFGAA